MRYPEFLKENGRIGFIAPSFGSVMEPYHTLFEAAIKKWEDMGYKTVLGPNVYEDKGVGKSNTPDKCGEEINDFFTHDKCDIIISCGGGETMCEDLPYVNFEAIKNAKPKWFMGYSDNTNLIFPLTVLCDTAAIYGPHAATFGTCPWHPALEDAWKVLKGEDLSLHNYDAWELSEAPSIDVGAPDNASEISKSDECSSLEINMQSAYPDTEESIFAPYNCTEPFSMRTFMGKEETTSEIKAEGRLLGGCLDSLIALCGTKYDKVKEFNEKYKEDGTLWFMEACDLNPMAIRRAYWQLKEAGWFDTTKGFIIGRALHYDEDYMGVNRINAAVDSLGDMGLPIFIDVDLGHLPPAMPLISGSIGKAKAKDGKFYIDMELR